MTFLRFLVLVVLLNVVRYLVAGVVEQALVLPHLFGAMAESPEYFMVASLKSFGLMWLMFAAVSAIYMNHYSHPRDFYLWNILDAVIAFATVAVANGLLYRRVLGPPARRSGAL